MAIRTTVSSKWETYKPRVVALAIGLIAGLPTKIFMPRGWATRADASGADSGMRSSARSFGWGRLKRRAWRLPTGPVKSSAPPSSWVTNPAAELLGVCRQTLRVWK